MCSFQDKVELEFEKIIKNAGLHKFIEHSGYSGTRFYAELTDKPEFYEKSIYSTSNRTFLHWTTIQNLFSIINNREIRFYNLFNSDDIEEYEYAGKHLLLSSEKQTFSKRYLYTFSFCSLKELSNQYLWKLYGKDYSGVAIEFELINDVNNWEKFMLSQVYYKIPDWLKLFGKEVNELHQKYNNQLNFEIDLGKIIAYYKNPKFKREEEFRLSVYHPYDNINKYDAYCCNEFKISHNRFPRLTNYFPLKLWVDNENPYIKPTHLIPYIDNRLNVSPDYFKKYPSIKIKNIHFGHKCGIKQNDYLDYKKVIEVSVLNKLGYEISINSKFIKS
jgi:hypothetical protein